MNDLAGFGGGLPLTPETSRELQVKSLMETAKEYGVEITKDVYDFTVKKVYGDKMDIFNACLPALEKILSAAMQKETGA